MMRNRAFTLVELLTVIAIIGVLASLILMTSGFVQKKAASSRAQAEIQALSAACESYKADNAAYPQPKTQTAPPTTYTPASYNAQSRALYQAASGDGDDALLGGTVASDGQQDADKKRYMDFKANMLGGLDANKKVTAAVFVQDPFGYSYGYYVPDPNATPAVPVIHNPTFDLWSTAGTTSATTSANQVKWITNW